MCLCACRNCECVPCVCTRAMCGAGAQLGDARNRPGDWPTHSDLQGARLEAPPPSLPPFHPRFPPPLPPWGGEPTQRGGAARLVAAARETQSSFHMRGGAAMASTRGGRRPDGRRHTTRPSLVPWAGMWFCPPSWAGALMWALLSSLCGRHCALPRVMSWRRRQHGTMPATWCASRMTREGEDRRRVHIDTSGSRRSHRARTARRHWAVHRHPGAHRVTHVGREDGPHDTTCEGWERSTPPPEEGGICSYTKRKV